MHIGIAETYVYANYHYPTLCPMSEGKNATEIQNGKKKMPCIKYFLFVISDIFLKFLL